jgi:hypothetical protein
VGRDKADGERAHRAEPAAGRVASRPIFQR